MEKNSDICRLGEGAGACKGIGGLAGSAKMHALELVEKSTLFLP